MVKQLFKILIFITTLTSYIHVDPFAHETLFHIRHSYIETLPQPTEMAGNAQKPLAGNAQKPVPQRMRGFQNKQAEINRLIINYLVKG